MKPTLNTAARCLAVYAIFAALVLVLAGCANTIEQKQVQVDTPLSVFSKGFKKACDDNVLTDPNLIRSGIAIIRQWKRLSVDIEVARAMGDTANLNHWENQLYGDGSKENPGLISRAATLALNWKK